MSEAAFSAEDRFRKLACADFELSAEVCCDFELGDKDAEEGLYIHNVLIRVLKTQRVLLFQLSLGYDNFFLFSRNSVLKFRSFFGIIL